MLGKLAGPFKRLQRLKGPMVVDEGVEALLFADGASRSLGAYR